MARAVRLAGVGLVIGAALCVFGIASAGVYRWRDAQGNWHFSDTPPPSSGATKGTQVKVEEVVLNSNFADAKVAIKPPIANPKRNGGASVALDNFGLKLDIAGSSNATIGRAFSGKDCSQSTDVQWSDGAVDLKGKVAEGAVAERFRNFGYLFVDGSDGAGSLADLHLDAELVAMKLDLCNSISMGNTFGSGSRGYVKVRWVLRAQPGGEPLYSGVSAGSFDAWHPGGGSKGTVLKALAAATDNLLGDHAFVDIVTGADSGHDHAATVLVAATKMSIVYGDGSGAFRGHSEELLRSAVTVRTSRGHGSGVLIDASGYALTNAHVVGADTQVKVMLDDDVVDARVVRTDKHVDVALLQFDPKGRNAATVAHGEPHAGDPLYVVGTPLDVKLSHTVTQGILSAIREVDGARLYQTDAAVNPGNSGGPVFNESGELVALSVSGLVNAEGSSLNVNYLIPVGRALTAVGATAD
ncbi:MAG: trypsin-like peptidase domain-containing protein [Dokdonella sp.]